MQFADDSSAGAAHSPRCCTGKGGRRLTFSPGHETLVAARARQETVDFKTVYRAHRGGVEGCLSGLVRGQGIWVNRYIGQAKNELRAVLSQQWGRVPAPGLPGPICGRVATIASIKRGATRCIGN
jgi:hypothetical protein